MRALAKDVGVSAPTKLNKAVLVDLVYKITNGEMTPPEAPRRGRPKKSAESTETTQTTSESKPERRYVEVLTASPSPAAEQSNETSLPRGFEKPKFQPTFRNQIQYQQNKNQNFNQRQNTYRSQNQSVRENILAERTEIDDSEQIREGYLEINPDGYGFLRVKNGEFNEMDAYVSAMKIKQYGLRRGDYVTSLCKKVQEGRPSAVVSVTTINGIESDKVGKRPNFDDLVPLSQRAHTPRSITQRVCNSLYRPCFAYRQRSKRYNCFATESRQNHAFENDCKFDCEELSRNRTQSFAHRRTPGRSHGYATLHKGRSGIFHFRRTSRASHQNR